ncbi:MAG TPA: glycosyltransferase [Lunatimonas sp.]|nr:glycosyltransferase [Lunatimonas sp.]
MVILEILAAACCFYLIFPFATGALASLLPSPVKPIPIVGSTSDFACVITVYKDLDIAWPLVKSLLSQRYSHFHIYLVADSVLAPHIKHQDPKFTLLLPTSPLNSKVASLNHALEKMDIKHTHVVVFDPDNLVAAHFLQVLDRYHQAGYPVVQGKRIAKNIDTTYAALDALGEYYYDYSVRNVPFLLGASSTIAGSGMSIQKDLYQKNIAHEMKELLANGVVVSEDKSLQLQLVRQGVRIAYAPAAIIFDEKISSSQQIGKQRGRWLNSYFRHSWEALKALGKGLAGLDWNIFLFSITVLMPPMVVLVGGSLLVMGIAIFIKPLMAYAIGIGILIFVAGFGLNLTLNRTPMRVMAAIPTIPLFVWGQLAGFMNIRRANKDFMVTDHTCNIEMEEIWAQRKHEFSHLKHWWNR